MDVGDISTGPTVVSMGRDMEEGAGARGTDQRGPGLPGPRPRALCWNEVARALTVRGAGS